MYIYLLIYLGASQGTSAPAMSVFSLFMPKSSIGTTKAKITKTKVMANMEFAGLSGSSVGLTASDTPLKPCKASNI